MNLFGVKSEYSPSLQCKTPIAMSIALEIGEIFAVVLPSVDLASEAVPRKSDIQPEPPVGDGSAKLPRQFPALQPLRPMPHAGSPELLLRQVSVYAAECSVRRGRPA